MIYLNPVKFVKLTLAPNDLGQSFSVESWHLVKISSVIKVVVGDQNWQKNILAPELEINSVGPIHGDITWRNQLFFE